jgi:acetate kinase
MSDPNIYTNDIFIKRLEHHLKKLSETLEQLDILIYSAGQTCRELKSTRHDQINR